MASSADRPIQLCGKTHTLLALYHLVAHGRDLTYLEPVEQILAESGLEAVPLARVVAVAGAHISPSQPRRTAEGLTLHTLWGEIAYRLAGAEGYQVVRQSDENRVALGAGTAPSSPIACRWMR